MRAAYPVGVNGQTAYTHEYTYPHPLVTGGGSPTPTPTASPSVSPTATATATPTCLPVGAPSGLACTAVSQTRIDLTWTDNSSNEINFYVERKTGINPFTQIAVLGAGVTSYQNVNLTSQTTYDYRVRAHNANCGDSSYSNTATCTTLGPSATPTPTATAPPSPTPTPTATPTPTPGSFAAVILATEPANLKGYWKCNETSGTTLADSSGNSKNLTITGAINTNYWLGESGEQGTCFRTDGVAGYASRNEAVIPSLDNKNFTLFALFKGGTDFGVRGCPGYL